MEFVIPEMIIFLMRKSCRKLDKYLTDWSTISCKGTLNCLGDFDFMDANHIPYQKKKKKKE